jgi:hypothetical protein
MMIVVSVTKEVYWPLCSPIVPIYVTLLQISQTTPTVTKKRREREREELIEKKGLSADVAKFWGKGC